MDSNFLDRIKRFFSGEMSSEEQKQFDQDIQKDEKLAQEVAEYIGTQVLVKEYKSQQAEDELMAALRKRRKNRNFSFSFSLILLLVLTGIGLYTIPTAERTLKLSYFFDITKDTTQANPAGTTTPKPKPQNSTSSIIINTKALSVNSDSAQTPDPKKPKIRNLTEELPQPIAKWEKEILEISYLNSFANIGVSPIKNDLDSLLFLYLEGKPGDLNLVIEKGLYWLNKLDKDKQKLELIIATAYYKQGKLREAIDYAKKAQYPIRSCCFRPAVKFEAIILLKMKRKKAVDTLLNQILWGGGQDSIDAQLYLDENLGNQ